MLTAAWLAALAPVAAADTVGVPMAVPGTGVLNGVACPTVHTCLAVGDAGSGEVLVPIRNGIPGAPIPVPGPYRLSGIACESATSCVAVGSNGVGVVVPIAGTTPGTPIAVPGTLSIDGVACQSATNCTAVGTASKTLNGVIVPIAGTTPGSRVTVPGIGLRAIACQTAARCTAVGDNLTSFSGVVLPITNGTPGAAVTVPGEPPGLDAIACQTASTCTAVGIDDNNFGVVARVSDGVPAAPVRPPRYAAFFGVACETATACEGAGQTGPLQKGAVVPIRNDKPGFPIAATRSLGYPSLNAVACVSATSCEVVGTDFGYGTVVATCRPAAAQGCATPSGYAASRGATVAAKVKCVGMSGQTCPIIEQLSTTTNQRLAKKRITIKAGDIDRLTLTLNRTWQRMLRKDVKLRVTLTISQAQPASPFIVLHHSMTLWRFNPSTELNAVSCSSPGACMAVGEGPRAAALAAERWDGRHWVHQLVSNKVKGSLTAVSCPSAGGCMAAGVKLGPRQNPLPISARWNGSAWTGESMPSPARMVFGGVSLDGVSCTSLDACTAVGDYTARSGYSKTLLALAERWNGRRWTIESAPLPARSTFSTFQGVSCSSQHSCIAAGYYLTRASVQLALVERWNGSRWRIEPVPRPARADSSFAGVSCSSRNACTAVGSYLGAHGSGALAERWNGRRWTIQPTPNSSRAGTVLDDVSCPDQRACTAVGSFISGRTYIALAEHWNGSRWRIQGVPASGDEPGTQILGAGVSCGAVLACVGVFTYDYNPGTKGEFTRGVAERWNGRRWAMQKLGTA